MLNEHVERLDLGIAAALRAGRLKRIGAEAGDFAD